ncbi:MAG: PEP-CTERM sorting domain-containing protein [Phycisphaerae bacterium]|nr:PEP-CTERM sorting domain-containing protein [Phycisphaerae bacterium]
MKKAIQLVCVVVAVSAAVGQSRGESPGVNGVTDDLWDISQGASITAGSPTEFFSLTSNMFGGQNVVLPNHGEKYNTIFQDWSSGGQLHFVEWQAALPITVRSFVLNAAHDPASLGRDIFWRGFSRFSLYAYDADTDSFDTKLFELLPSDPFGDTLSPPQAIVRTDVPENHLSLAANVFSAPTTNRFRAEFVTPGDANLSYLSPRILELDGFDTFYPGVPIPEPATFTLLTLGGLALIRRRKLMACK